MLKLVSAVKTLLGMKPQATPLVQGRAHSLEKSSLSPASTCRCCPDPRRTSELAGASGAWGTQGRSVGRRFWAEPVSHTHRRSRASLRSPPGAPASGCFSLRGPALVAEEPPQTSDTACPWWRLPGSAHTCSVLQAGAAALLPEWSPALLETAGRVGTAGHCVWAPAGGSQSPVARAVTSSMKQGATRAFPTALSRSRWLPS